MDLTWNLARQRSEPSTWKSFSRLLKLGNRPWKPYSLGTCKPSLTRAEVRRPWKPFLGHWNLASPAWESCVGILLLSLAWEPHLLQTHAWETYLRTQQPDLAAVFGNPVWKRTCRGTGLQLRSLFKAVPDLFQELYYGLRSQTLILGDASRHDYISRLDLVWPSSKPTSGTK